MKTIGILVCCVAVTAVIVLALRASRSQCSAGNNIVQRDSATTVPWIDPNDLAAEEDIAEFEKAIGNHLPSDYRHFLLHTNGGTVGPDNVVFSSKRTPNARSKSSQLKRLYGLLGESLLSLQPSFDLRREKCFWEDRIPRDLVPIGEVYGGQLCLRMSRNGNGSVYLWSQDEEQDDPTYENVYLVSESFQEFLANCKIEIEELIVASTTVFQSISHGNAAYLESLLEHGLDVNLRDEKGRTLLHVAVICGRMELVQRLIDHRAEINVVDQTGRPLIFDAHWRHVLNCLLDNGGNVNAIDRQGRSLLMELVENDYKLVEVVVKRGADASIVALNGDTAMILFEKWIENSQRNNNDRSQEEIDCLRKLLKSAGARR